MLIDNKMDLTGFVVINMAGAKMQAPVKYKSVQPERKLGLKYFQNVYLSINTGVLYHSSGAPINDSVYMVDKSALSQELMDNAECWQRRDICSVVTYNAGWRNYFHTLIQAGLSTWIVAQYYDMASIHFIFPRSNDRFVELLELCDLKVQNCTFFEKTKIVKLANAGIIDTTYGGYAYAPSSFLMHYSDALMAKIESDISSCERVYISRRDSHNRVMSNERHIEEQMVKLGFAVFCLSGISFHDQAKLFRNAKTIVSPHGAGLSNIIFCKPKTQIIELTMDSYVNPCFVRIAQAFDFNYFLIVVPSIVKSANKNDSTWCIDQSELAEIFDKILY